MKAHPAASVAEGAGWSSPPFEELDVVALREPFAVSADASLPRGAEGTVVGVWAGGQAYEVEFVEPVPALVTLRPSQPPPRSGLVTAVDPRTSVTLTIAQAKLTRYLLDLSSKHGRGKAKFFLDNGFTADTLEKACSFTAQGGHWTA